MRGNAVLNVLPPYVNPRIIQISIVGRTQHWALCSAVAILKFLVQIYCFNYGLQIYIYHWASQITYPVWCYLRAQAHPLTIC